MEVLVSAEVLEAKEALASAMVLGQDLAEGLEAASVASVASVALVALVADLMAGLEDKAFPLAHRVASRK